MLYTTAIVISLLGAVSDAPLSPYAGAAFVLAAAVACAATARTRGPLARRTDKQAAALPAPADSVSPRARRPRRVLIVGAGARGRELARAILDHPELGYRVIGFVEDDPAVSGWDGIPILGRTCDIGALIERQAAEEIMIAHAPSWYDSLMRQLVASGRDDQVRVSSALGIREAMSGDLRLRRIADIPLVPVSSARPRCCYYGAKRCFDVAFSLAALTVTAPLIALLALLVKITSRGPAFFCQQRVGRQGKRFLIFKLRTMVRDAERDTGPALADPYDARVTPLGRLLRVTRLDELPQFLNVLRGEMSVVGPRPERPEFTSRFLAEIPGYAKRMTIKPGITGLAQIYGGYDTDVYTKLRYDWAYVYRQSAWLDARILLGTIRVVLTCGGR